MVPDWVSYGSLVFSLLAVLLVLGEWSFIYLSLRRLNRIVQGFAETLVGGIVSGVTTAVRNLRPGRGKGRTVVETIAEDVPEEETAIQPAAPMGAPAGLGGLLEGVDPRALQEGMPLLKKFMDGGKFTPEETAKGLQLLGYASKVAQSKGLLRPGSGGSGGGSGMGGGGSSSWE